MEQYQKSVDDIRASVADLEKQIAAANRWQVGVSCALAFIIFETLLFVASDLNSVFRSNRSGIDQKIQYIKSTVVQETNDMKAQIYQLENKVFQNKIKIEQLESEIRNDKRRVDRRLELLESSCGKR